MQKRVFIFMLKDCLHPRGMECGECLVEARSGAQG